MARHFQKITFNLTPSNKRYETLEGKQYLVVPYVGLTEGVHNGSEGPLYYPPEELAKNPVTDNHRPVVVYHPMLNGQGVTATDKEVMERQKTGITMQADYDGRRKGEVWFDENKLERVDRRVLANIHAGKPVEVSTGIYHDLEEKAGERNGQKYTGIVRNMVLDHLAILPDQVGACSIAKGAGLLINADHGLSHNDVMDHLHSEHNKTSSPYGDSPLSYRDRIHIHDVFPKHVVYEKGDKTYKHEYKVKNGKASFHGEPEQVHKQTSYVCANGEALVRNDTESGPITVVKRPKLSEMSEDMRKQQFQKTLSEKLAGNEQNGEWGGWVQEVLANHVVWSKDGKLLRLPYTYDDDKIKLGEDPEEVERVEGKASEYRRKNNISIDGSSSPPNINQLYTFNLEPKMPPTPQQMQIACNRYADHLVKTLKVPLAQARQIVQNAVHQGAHEEIFGAVSHMDAHHAPESGRGDGQARSTVGGARKDAVDKMVGSGHWREEDRQFLMDLPDDKWERVSKQALGGAAQEIVPYTYAGIGDRSNVHTATSASGTHNQAQPQNFDQWLANQPREMQPVLRNMAKTYGQQKQRLAQLVFNSRRSTYTLEQLLALDPEMLEQMARLVGTGQQTQNSGAFDLETAVVQNNYAGGGGEITFDLDPQPPTQNVAQDVLPLPQNSWLDAPAQTA